MLKILFPDGNQIYLLIIGLYGMLFRRNKEAAFSNYRLWESAGFVIAYAYSTTLCARMKLYVLFGNLCIGMICYIIVEIRHRRKVEIRFALMLKCIPNAYNSHYINRNEDSRNKKPRMQLPDKPNWQHTKSKRPTTRETTWRMTLKSLTFRRLTYKNSQPTFEINIIQFLYIYANIHICLNGVQIICEVKLLTSISSILHRNIV